MCFITFLWPSVLLFSMMAHALPVGGDVPPPHHEELSAINLRKPAVAIKVFKPPQWTSIWLSWLRGVTEITYTLLPPSAHVPPNFQALLYENGLTESSYLNWANDFAESLFKQLHVTTATLEPQASSRLLSPPTYWKFKITTPNVLVVNHGKFPQVRSVNGQDHDHGPYWDVVSMGASDGRSSLLENTPHVAAIIPAPCEVVFSLGRVDGRLELVAHFQQHHDSRSSISTKFEAVFKPRIVGGKKGEPDVKLSGSFLEATLKLDLTAKDEKMLALFV
ncbi:hypothetical protein EV361DRAFT_920492 [Lentinula raphanica]|nr:hypothetical protein EV361DRAFT_920492 [Lentinula raphanica]